MNKLLTLLFIIFHFVGYSQNWELIQEEEIYYYSRTDSIGIVNTMRVSDINTFGNNVIFTLYSNYLVPNDSCVYYQDEFQLSGGFWFPTDSICHFYDSNRNILGHQILSTGNGEFYFEDGLRIIKTLAEVNEEWIFDSSLNYTAEVTNISEQVFLGTTDSLKTIMIFDSTDLVVDSILISKHFGLMRYPLWNGDYYILEGVQSNDSFESMPLFEEVFDYSIGDVFVYYFIHSEVVDIAPAGISTTSRFEIIDIDTIDSHVVYLCNSIHRKHLFDGESEIFSTWSGIVDSVIYDPNLLYGEVYSYPGEIAPMRMQSNIMNIGYWDMGIAPTGMESFGFDSLFASMSYLDLESALNSDLSYYLFNPDGIELESKVMWKGFPFGCYGCVGNEEFYPHAFISKKSLIQPSKHADISEGIIASISNYTQVFQEDFGLVYMGYFYFEAGAEMFLMGTIKDGIQYGNVPTAAQLLLGVDELKDNQIDIKVYPNPFVHFLTIQNNDSQGLLLEVFDILGQSLFKRELSSGKNEIDMTPYNGNAFILQFISDKGISTKKILRIKD